MAVETNRLRFLLPPGDPEELNITPGSPVMIVAPHPDDELFGCGLLIEKLSGKNPMTIVFVTGGEAFSVGGAGSQARHLEAESVTRSIGAELIWMGFRDKELKGQEYLLTEAFEDLFYTHRPEHIFLPFFADYHIDHRIASISATEGLRILPYNYHGYYYSTLSPLFPLKPYNFLKLTEKETFVLENLKQYRASASPKVVETWIELRKMTAMVYLQQKIFWEPYFHFNPEMLQSVIESMERWPQIYPFLNRPRNWNRFLNDVTSLKRNFFDAC